MKRLNVFLVGGAVRDLILGIESNDKDYVVVGSNEAEMVSLGFIKVGKDFPVFLHPETKDEYALARVEFSTGNSYKDFSFQTNNVTLKEDLSRRDITCNSLSMNVETGEIIDYFNGQEDLKNGILRHTSNAFIEDPVRILRIARFAARYKFTIADETKTLIKEMINKGMLNSLVPDRVFKELEKVLKLDNPEIFFLVLDDLGALDILFPELAKLKGQTQPEKWHPEGDAFIHTLLVLQEAVKHTDDIIIRFASLTHDFGKICSPVETLPQHHGHELAGVKIIHNFCDRLNIPNKFRDVAVITSREHLNIHNFNKLNYKTILNIFERCDAFRKPEQFKCMLIASICDANGRGPTIEKIPFKKVDDIMLLLNKTKNVDVTELQDLKLTGNSAKEFVRRKRLELIKHERPVV